MSSLDSSSEGLFFNAQWPSAWKDSGRINDYSSSTSLTSLCILIESSIDSSTEGSFFNAQCVCVSKDSGIINDYPSNTSLTSLCKLIESSIDSSTGGTFFNAFLCQKILVEIMTIFLILL